MSDLFTTIALEGEALRSDRGDQRLLAAVREVVAARDERLRREGFSDEVGRFDLVTIAVPAGRGAAIAHAKMLNGAVATHEVHRAAALVGDEIGGGEDTERIRSAIDKAVSARDERLREIGHLDEVGSFDLVIAAVAPGRGETIAGISSTHRRNRQRRSVQKESSRTGFHGLPAEYRTQEGIPEDWQTTLGYLAALEKSHRPITVAVKGQNGAPAAEQIGLLRQDGQRRGTSRLISEQFSVLWPSADQLSGRVTLYEHLFEGAFLSTVDGDDYFGLRLDFGSFHIVFADSAINLDAAHPRRKRELDDLPTADELSHDLATAEDQTVVVEIREETAQLRKTLIELGAERAAEMTDEEIIAEAVRVRWKVDQHQRRGEPRPEWLEPLAKAIIEGGAKS